VTVAGAGSTWTIDGDLRVGNDGSDDKGVGTLRIQAGGTVIGGRTKLHQGDSVILEGGTLSTFAIDFLQGQGTFQWTSGTLHVGVFQGNLVNSSGILAPGSSIGATEIQGNYDQLTDGTLDIEIGPVGQSPQNDLVTVTGTATIDGQLSLGLTGGADPLPSQTFIILDANTLTGSFDNIANGQRLTTSDALGSFLVHYGAGSAFDPTQIVLSNFLSAGIPGDFDLDGDVDGRDLLLWQRGDSPSPLSAGDLADWQANYGAGEIAAASTAVPEPGAWWLIAMLGNAVALAGRGPLERSRRAEAT
jgi:T5SS/PEP-CTERM-associated repeat protein